MHPTCLPLIDPIGNLPNAAVVDGDARQIPEILLPIQIRRVKLVGRPRRLDSLKLIPHGISKSLGLARHDVSGKSDQVRFKVGLRHHAIYFFRQESVLDLNSLLIDGLENPRTTQIVEILQPYLRAPHRHDLASDKDEHRRSDCEAPRDIVRRTQTDRLAHPIVR